MTVSTTIERRTESRARISAPVLQQVGSWLLVLTLVFLIAQGNFSFSFSNDTGATYLNTAPKQSFPFLAYFVFPGFAYSVIAWRILTHLGGIVPIIFRMKTITCLALLCICSTAWSQQPVRSLYESIFYFLCTLFAFYLLARYRLEDIMSLVMAAAVFAAIAGMVLVVIHPDWGLAPQEARTAGAWRGIFTNRTAAGKFFVFLVSPALVFGYRKMSLSRFVFICLMVLSIVMARAVTAILVLSAFTVFMTILNLSRRVPYKTAAVIAVALLPVCIGVGYFAVLFAPDVFGYFGRDVTLTGRTDVWIACLASALKHPFLGYGFYAFWLGFQGESANVINAMHWFFGYAHNGLLEILLQVGLIGLTLFLITFFHAVKDAFTCLRGRRSLGIDWLIGILLLTLLYNIDEETVMFPSHLLSTLYVLACCGLSVAAARVKADYTRGTFGTTCQPSITY